MTDFIKKHIIKFWPILAIALIEAALFLANFKPGTWLIGWDNLYPELDFGLNIKRTFFGVWQEYRSLGYMDGMSHSANLIHDIFRFMLSWIFPTNMIRWVFVFLMHLLGGIGMYVLLSKYVLRSRNKFRMTTVLSTQTLSLFGALFYQYNLITVQQFFLPFELFIIHFAFLPWLIYLALSYFETGKKRTLYWFGFVSFLSVPQAHVPTIFIVYIMALGIIMAAKVFMREKQALKRSIVLIIATFVINAFWGIPFAYATIQNSHIIANSKNNQMGTDDIFYRNLKFGDFSDVAQFKGIVLDYWQYDIHSGASHFMMHPWLDHIATPWFFVPAWMFALLILIGVISVFVRRKKHVYPLAVLFIFGFVMMANDTPIVSLVSAFLREFVPLFHNVFRFTFTKFSILYAFGGAIFLVLGIEYLMSYVKKSTFQYLLLASLFLLLTSYSFPSFQKHFFYENLAATMPKDYHDTFEFFKTQDTDTRVAMLPIPNYWAWTQNNWNTIGSGFLWYGIPQPTTDRAFDPWSAYNENFYWELDQAIFSENEHKLELVLDKHDISWILLDSSVYQDSSPKFDTDRYRALINKSSVIRPVTSFGSIEIYSFEGGNQEESFVSILSDVPSIGPAYTYDSDDTAYENVGTYSVEDIPEIYFPYRTLFSGKNTEDTEFVAGEIEDYIYFKTTIPQELKNYYLKFPPLDPNEFIVYKPNTYGSTYYEAIILLDGQEIFRTGNENAAQGLTVLLEDFPNGILQIAIQKASTMTYSMVNDTSLKSMTNDGCYKNPDGKADFNASINGLMFSSQTSNNCVNIDLASLSQRVGYVFFVETENSPTKGLHFNLINKTSRKTDLETYFDHDGAKGKYQMILPPRAYYGAGYALNINNVSFGKEQVTNTLKAVSMYQIPYDFLKNITLHKSIDKTPVVRATRPDSATQTADNRFHIEISPTNVEENSLLYLSQGFDPGWKAYSTCETKSVICTIQNLFPMFFGKELKDHVLVNNWANAWHLHQDYGDPKGTIVIIFWPQYLEFVGFGLLIVALIGIVLRKKKST